MPPGLEPADLHAEPAVQVQTWLDAARAAGVVEPTAMTLATADAAGRPSVRAVLLKGLDAQGAVFYTNYGSAKARDLDENPHAALALVWPALHRQVRIAGAVTRTSAEESDAYFASRAPGSRLGAIASPQSEVIADRAVLERRIAEAAARHPDGLPRPPHWGGYRVALDRVELWQGRPDRLHDRLRYVSAPGDGWRIERLAP
ncbi:MAG: pyridoxamine 5'-phosphate oxidase [Egibacteraceae bacterium]